MINQEQIDHIQEIAQHFLELMNLKLKAEVYANEDEVEVNITGGDRAYLITDEGETLLSLQYILAKMIRQQLKELMVLRLFLDSDGFLYRHEQQLRRLVFRAMERVRKERRRIRLRPMNPYDRRIVHMEVALNEDLDSISEGEGFFKKVIVQRKSYRSDEFA